jgi:uncharacterized protein YecT (DUF1311 family)
MLHQRTTCIRVTSSHCRLNAEANTGHADCNNVRMSCHGWMRPGGYQVNLKPSALFVSVMLSLCAHAAPCDSVMENDKLAQCLGVEFEKADARLNQRYAALRKSMSEEQRQILKRAQTAWVTVRDADCELQVARLAEPGSQAYQPAVLSCLTEKTLRRIEDFKELKQ